MQKVDNVNHIVAEIIDAKPHLPSEDILQKLSFKWNNTDLSTWDGGKDVNAEIRAKVVEVLRKYFEQKDAQFAELLRFLLKQEIENCYESEIATDALQICYDNLAQYEIYGGYSAFASG